MSTRSCRPLADNGPGPPHRSRIKPSRPRRLQRSKQLTSAGRAVVCTYRRLHPARGRVWLKKVSARSTARRLSPHRFRYLVCSNRHHRRRCVCIYITVTRPTCTQREKKKKKGEKKSRWDNNTSSPCLRCAALMACVMLPHLYACSTQRGKDLKKN